MLSNLKGYFRPKSIPEVLALLEKDSGSILVIAGGTKLVQSPNDVVQELVDITSLGLNYIKENAGEIRIGATTPLQKIVNSPILKRLTDGVISRAAHLSNPSKMIRNVSTIGGELITTDSLSLFYCALLVMQGQVRIAGGDEFALAMNIFLNKKGLGGGILTEVIIPKMGPQTYASITPVFQHQPKPIICAAARVTIDKGRCKNVKLAITGTAKVPQRLHKVENLLESKEFTDSNIESAADITYELYNPISDSLASEEFRKEAGRMVIKKALIQCLENAQENI